jgi:hypothetical protein
MHIVIEEGNSRMMPRFDGPNESPIRFLVDLVCGKVPLLLLESEGDKVGRFVATCKIL